MANLGAKLGANIIRWLTQEAEPAGMPLCDFDRLGFEIRPCDVLLVEGRTRVSQVIKTITQSIWTHSALYIGRLHDIDDPDLRAYVRYFYDGNPNDQLLIEPLLGEGTVVSPLSKYRNDHLRICRPVGLTHPDEQAVIKYAAQHISLRYDVRQLLDLARFVFPYGVLPRRWRSTLFEHNPGPPTKTVCSTMIASAFASVHYPIRPVVQRDDDGSLRFYKRNARLHIPSDFDHSPYFSIIKYPVLGLDDLTVYRQLPWNEDGVVCNSENDCYIPQPNGKRIPVKIARGNGASAEWKPFVAKAPPVSNDKTMKGSELEPGEEPSPSTAP